MCPVDSEMKCEELTYRRYFAQLKSIEDAVELQLAVDIGLFLLRVGRFIDGGHDDLGIM